MHDVILLVNAEHMYHLRRVPAANHAQSRSTAMTPTLGLGLGLRSVSIRYSARHSSSPHVLGVEIITVAYEPRTC